MNNPHAEQRTVFSISAMQTSAVYTPVHAEDILLPFVSSDTSRESY